MSTQLDIFGKLPQPYRYLIVVEPDAITTQVVARLKKRLHGLYPLSAENRNAKAHLTLCHYDAKTASDETILQLIRQAVKGIESFNVELDGLEIWPSSGTIALKVIHPERSVELMTKVQKALKKNEGKTPHITIARNLALGIVEKLEIGEQFEYSGHFRCNAVTVLRRSFDPGAHYEIVGKIALD